MEGSRLHSLKRVWCLLVHHDWLVCIVLWSGRELKCAIQREVRIAPGLSDKKSWLKKLIHESRGELAIKPFGVLLISPDIMQLMIVNLNFKLYITVS